MREEFKRHRLLFIFTIFIGSIISLVNILVAFLIGKIIDNITGGGLSKFGFFVGLLIVFIISYILLGSFYSYLAGLFSKKMLQGLKSRVYKHLFNMPIYDYEEKDVAFYYNMLTHDIDEIEKNYIGKTYSTIVSIITFVISIVALFSINWLMAIIFIILTVLIVLVPSFISVIQKNARDRFSKSSESFMKELENILSGFESIKALNISKALFNKIEEEDKGLEESRLHGTLIDGCSSSVIIGMTYAVQLLCMLVGTYFVIKGKITIGSLIMAIQILNTIVMPVNTISNNNNLMNSTQSLREKLEAYLTNNITEGQEISQGDIVVENLSIKLGDKQVLNNFNYEFKTGSSYIIIGESGSGKSTLAKLIAGFYRNFEGKIKYNNIDISYINVGSIPKIIRYIGANTYVINDSLKENIRMYRDYSDAEVEVVAEKVGFDKAMLNKNELGHGGKFISSGEYQRIAIARAMLEKPFCIILDEVTANLDKENTRNVREIIKSLDVPIKLVISHDYDDEYLNYFDHILNLSENYNRKLNT